ncbi:MAG: phosphotransferase [Eubacterium sp.]|nr:phosphotransferase [Eubacterium sp.]
MLELNKDNLLSYVVSKLDFFDPEGTVTISAVGEGSAEDDGDGFINYVFRISDGKHPLIVKQTLPTSRLGSFKVDENRFHLEYRSMQLRKAIVPDLVPDVYYCDDENRIVITEDVSRLKISRFQLLQGVQFPRLADQVARYMAATEFYTSEYYLDRKSFRELSVYFTNTTMRNIMDCVMFLTSVVPEDTIGKPLDPEFEQFSRKICADPNVLLARQKLRHLFMTKGECLIHGDLHTSNIFAGPDECKVIDMEYTFCGPFAYDMGYFLANFIAQYECASFRPFLSEEERKSYKDYCISVIRDTYNKFCEYFITYCHEDSKEVYRNIYGLEDDFRKTTLREFIGFAASAQLGRITAEVAYPDYDDIPDYVDRHNAKCLSIIVDWVMLNKWETYESIDEFINDLLTVESIYTKVIRESD